MKAAVMEGVRKPLVVRDMPDPQCPPNGAILKTAAEGHLPLRLASVVGRLDVGRPCAGDADDYGT